MARPELRAILLVMLAWAACARAGVDGHCDGVERMAETRVHAGHAAVNGVSLYFEDHGPRVGVPLVLLNGGGSSIEVTWGRALPILALNPDPEALRRMHDRDAERMRNFRDVPDEQVRAVQVPVLVLAGDRDVASPEHAAGLARLFPRGRLMILPGGHGEYLGERLSSPPGSCYPQRALPLVQHFLDEPDEKQ